MYPDPFPEVTEAFQVSVSPEDSRLLPNGMIETLPNSLNPSTLATEIFVVIEDDDDCKLKSHHAVFIMHLLAISFSYFCWLC